MKGISLAGLIMLTLMPLSPIQAATDAFDVREGTRPPLGYARPPFHIKRNSAAGPVGLVPAQIRHVYGFDQLANKGSGQVLAIVDAYDDPNIASDLSTFTAAFGLPACNVQKVYANGIKPRTNSGWALEMALDVEWACAIAPQAKIVLVEAASSSFTDLMAAVDKAVALNASVVSMSWGGSEFSGETAYDYHFANAPGVLFAASSGDSGAGVEYPAASPYVVAVGGTTLSTDAKGDYLGEVAWSGSGGGQSAVETEPAFQAALPVPGDGAQARGVPDVAYDGDPNTGVAVYSSVKYNGQSGWFQLGGTSVGAPQWAALVAVADSVRAAQGKGTLSVLPSAASGSPLYNLAAGTGYSANYHDVAAGSNGTCGPLCTATTGYDYVTGIGSPQAGNDVTALGNQ